MFEGQEPNFNLNIKPEDMKDHNCSRCGSAIWKQAILVKVIPALLAGNPKDTIVPVEMIVCDECGISLPESLTMAEAEEKATSKIELVKE